MTKKKAHKLREEVQKCFRAVNRATDDRIAAALMAYACHLEQRARLVERPKNKPPRKDQ